MWGGTREDWEDPGAEDMIGARGIDCAPAGGRTGEDEGTGDVPSVRGTFFDVIRRVKRLASLPGCGTTVTPDDPGRSSGLRGVGFSSASTPRLSLPLICSVFRTITFSSAMSGTSEPSSRTPSFLSLLSDGCRLTVFLTPSHPRTPGALMVSASTASEGVSSLAAGAWGPLPSELVGMTGVPLPKSSDKLRARLTLAFFPSSMTVESSLAWLS